MREFAGEGKYFIWGKDDPARLHQRIPNEFWVDNQIDFLRLAADTAEKAPPVGSGRPSGSSWGCWKRLTAGLMLPLCSYDEQMEN